MSDLRAPRVGVAVAVALLLCALGVPSTARAGQQADSGGPPVQIYSSFVTVGADDGFIVDGDFVDDIVFTLVPGAIAYQGGSPRSSLSLIYEPQVELFEAHPELNAWNHGAAGRYSRDLTRRLNLEIGGTFLATEDRGRDSPGVTFSQRGLFMEGRMNGAVLYQLDAATRIDAQFSGALTRSQVAESLIGEPSDDADLFANESSVAIGAGVSRRIGEIHSISGSYRFLRSELLNPEEFPPDFLQQLTSSQDSVTVGYAISTPAGLRVSAGVGILRTIQGPETDPYTPSFFAGIEKRSRAWTARAGYGRTLSGFRRLDNGVDPPQAGDPLLINQVVDSLDFELSAELGRRVLLDHRTTLSRTSLDPNPDPLESAYVAVGLGVRAGRKFEPFAIASYFSQSATAESPSYSRTRILGGLRFYWGASSPNPMQAPSEPARTLLPTRRAQVQR